METKSEALRSQIALQCAKAALLLTSLKNRTSSAEEYEALEMEKVVMSLKVDLARERKRMRQVKLCGVMEMLIQVHLSQVEKKIKLDTRRNANTDVFTPS